MRSAITTTLLCLLLVRCGGGSPPDELAAGVVLSRAPVEKRELYANPTLNIVSDIAFDAEAGLMLIAGSRGAALVGADSRTVRAASFEGFGLHDANILRREPMADSLITISTFDGEPIVAAFDLNGRRLWGFEDEGRFSGTHALASEVGPRGAVVISSENKGLVFIDAVSGTVVRTIKSKLAPEIRHADLDSDHRTDLLLMNDQGLSRLDLTGRLEAQNPLIASWAVTDAYGGPQQVALWDGKQFQLLGRSLKSELDIREAFRGSAIPALSLAAAATQFEPSGRLQLVSFLLKGRGGWHRTTLLLYDGNGRLLYHEVIAGDCAAVHFLGPKDDVYHLLVGCRNAVVEYQVRVPPPA